MAVKQGALFVSAEAPYPMAGGGPLRSASLLNYLAMRYDLDVVVFREPGAPDPRTALPDGLTRSVLVVDLKFHSRTPAARAARNVARLMRGMPALMDRFAGYEDQIIPFLRDREYGVSLIEHFWCAGYQRLLAPQSRSTVLDMHNIESTLYSLHGTVERWPVSAAYRVLSRQCRALEQQLLPRFSSILVPSTEAAKEVHAISPGSKVTVYPNALPFSAQPEREEVNMIVFSGNMEYPPNIAAVRFFRREIWPRLREKWPDLMWRLIGKNPGGVERYVRGDSRIQNSGEVQDAVREIAAARVAVVPLLSGSGTRLKILEAWAAARPVVSTTLGAEGLGARHDGDILLADSAADFDAAVSSLLASESLRSRIGRAGRLTYEQRFTWEAAWRSLRNGHL